MGYSLESIMAGFPDGLYLRQLKTIIQQGGFETSNYELRQSLLNSKQISCNNGKYYFIQVKEDVYDQELKIAMKDLIKTLKHFTMILQKSRIVERFNDSEEESDREEYNPHEESDLDEDTMPRKFWVKKKSEKKPIPRYREQAKH